jgi:hypothetical protein
LRLVVGQGIGVARFPRTGLIPWWGGRRWTDFPSRRAPTFTCRHSGRSAGARTTPAPTTAQDPAVTWPIRDPAPGRQHSWGRRPAARGQDVARLGGHLPAVPGRPLGRAVPASRGKRHEQASTQALHPCRIGRAARSVEGHGRRFPATAAGCSAWPGCWPSRVPPGQAGLLQPVDGSGHRGRLTLERLGEQRQPRPGGCGPTAARRRERAGPGHRVAARQEAGSRDCRPWPLLANTTLLNMDITSF